MQGNVLSAAKWLGASFVLGCLIVALGVHWTPSIHSHGLEEAIRLRSTRDVQQERRPTGPEAAVGQVKPDPRTEQLRLQSEELRQTDGEWKRFWFNDAPSQPKSDVLHGAILQSGERWTADTARQDVLGVFDQQTSSEHVLNKTIFNNNFEIGSEKLTVNGLAKLDKLAKCYSGSDYKLYLATARDVAYDSAAPEMLPEVRSELDTKRAVAIQKYLTASNARRMNSYDVVVIDFAE